MAKTRRRFTVDCKKRAALVNLCRFADTVAPCGRKQNTAALDPSRSCSGVHSPEHSAF